MEHTNHKKIKKVKVEKSESIVADVVNGFKILTGMKTPDWDKKKKNGGNK